MVGRKQVQCENTDWLAWEMRMSGDKVFLKKDNNSQPSYASTPPAVSHAKLGSFRHNSERC